MFEIVTILSCFGLLVGVFIGYWILTGYPKQQARRLQQKFVSLGDMRGKTLAQIEQVAGKASGFSSLGGDKSSYTWHTTRYHISLIFNGDICEGVSSEISV